MRGGFCHDQGQRNLPHRRVSGLYRWREHFYQHSCVGRRRAAGRGGRPGSGVVAGGGAAGVFVVTLDAVIVNVALPDIRRDLAGGMSGLQWVVDGYTLMFAALLLSAGSLSDRVGARRAFGAGMVLFVLASAGCGLAPSLPALVAARLVQG